MAERITLAFEKGKKTVDVTMSGSRLDSQTDGDSGERRPSFESTYSVSSSDILSLFNKDWSTGYFSVSQDGPIYLENKGGLTLIVAQRGLRTDQSIRWGRGESPRTLSVTTPWSIGLFLLKKDSSDNYTLYESWMYTTTGPALGAYTQLHSAFWMGNVYNDHRICWGSTTTGRATQRVSIASVTNFINDYFGETFTGDLSRNTDGWENFTSSGRNPGARIDRLDSVIRSIWQRF